MKILNPLLQQVDQISRRKISGICKWLKELEVNNKGAIQELLDWSEQMYNDSDRVEERKKLQIRLGIREAAIVKPHKVLNAWAKGYGVDYSLLENGPSGHNK